MAGAGYAADTPRVVSATEALAMGPTLSPSGRSGRYEMTVVSAARGGKATFLNSTADYTAADNLTFSIAPIVAKALTKRYGTPPEDYFKGRTVTVDGILQVEPVVAVVAGRPHHLARHQVVVQVRQASQIVAVR